MSAAIISCYGRAGQVAAPLTRPTEIADAVVLAALRPKSTRDPQDGLKSLDVIGRGSSTLVELTEYLGIAKERLEEIMNRLSEAGLVTQTYYGEYSLSDEALKRDVYDPVYPRDRMPKPKLHAVAG